ncbi:MlaD family protein [Candidatus Palauibacter sp.]|uniref:MlaD family protein n=1 Tax=Candidatus Palauibacter sp. TaxID=3101350 RepID=UPI003B012CC2
MADLDPAYRPTPARIRVGFVLIVLAGLVAGTVFSGDAIVRARLEGPRITVLSHSAAGLGPGSAVWVAGRPMGRVLSISFRPPDSVVADSSHPAHVVIDAVIERGAEPILRVDATAEVRESDLMAPVIVAVHPGTGSAPPWNYSDTLRADGRPLDPELVLALADTLLQAIRSLDARASEARNTIASAQGSFRRFRQEPETMEGLKRSFEMFRELVERDVSRSSLSRLATDSLVGTAVDRVRERIAALDAAPERRTSRASIEAAVAALDAMGARLSSLARRIERGEGTAGRALMDGEIRRQFDALRATAAALAEELMLDPSRWLRVRVF